MIAILGELPRNFIANRIVNYLNSSGAGPTLEGTSAIFDDFGYFNTFSSLVSYGNPDIYRNSLQPLGSVGN